MEFQNHSVKKDDKLTSLLSIWAKIKAFTFTKSGKSVDYTHDKHLIPKLQDYLG
jgi:hypothetical protein